ncbi:hypothetical protein B0H63DRAFT_88103 [Podospora didyma]|uniref:Uncharacterized protein n=1 Tax=Podospora didyma TaxID=330526 RepID=A0AAE0K0V5_9PEZI|nr:hypothetical protein B0H63DRAFT_88103 [Podospora didyma]
MQAFGGCPIAHRSCLPVGAFLPLTTAIFGSFAAVTILPPPPAVLNPACPLSYSSWTRSQQKSWTSSFPTVSRLEPPRARYAPISVAWQCAIERETFRSVTIHVFKFTYFNAVLASPLAEPRRRTLLREVTCHIPCNTWPCTYSAATIVNLFAVLSQTGSAASLTLEFLITHARGCYNHTSGTIKCAPPTRLGEAELEAFGCLPSIPIISKLRFPVYDQRVLFLTACPILSMSPGGLIRPTCHFSSTPCPT